MKSISLMLGATVLISSSASAAFTGWSVVFEGTRGAGAAARDVYSVYANFDQANNVLLNCFNHNVIAGTMADVRQTGNNTWNPSATDTNNEDFLDSYVTIDGLTANSGPNYSLPTTVTALDPSFSPSTGSVIPINAGWFTSAPATNILAGVSGRVKMMQVATTVGGAGYTASMGMGYKNFGTTTALYGYGNYTIPVPAPGALALLGIAGAFGRRRRA